VDDMKRFHQFYELRRTFRGSANYHILGIDIAKEKHHLFPEPRMAKQSGVVWSLPMILSDTRNSLNRSSLS
jgi:hypothetical protein